MVNTPGSKYGSPELDRLMSTKVRHERDRERQLNVNSLRAGREEIYQRQLSTNEPHWAASAAARGWHLGMEPNTLSTNKAIARAEAGGAFVSQYASMSAKESANFYLSDPNGGGAMRGLYENLSIETARAGSTRQQVVNDMANPAFAAKFAGMNNADQAKYLSKMTNADSRLASAAQSVNIGRFVTDEQGRRDDAGMLQQAGGFRSGMHLGQAKQAENKAWEELVAALKDNTKNLEDSSRNYKDAKLKLEGAHQGRANMVGLLTSAGGGGQGGWLAGKAMGGGLAGGIAMGVLAAGAVANIAGQALSEGANIAIDYKNVQAGMAEWQNRRFDDWRAASRGNIASMMRLQVGYGVAENFSDKVGMAAGWGGGLQAGGGLILNPLDAVGGASNMARAGLGITGGMARLAGQQVDMRLLNAMNYVNTETMQTAADAFTGIGLSTRGFGQAGRERLIPELIKVNNIKALANTGIGADDIANLTRQAAQDLGGEYRGFDTLQRAGQVQWGGSLSKEQYISAAGVMSMAGGNSEDRLRRIIEQGTAAGMNNSKNIQQMVQATVQLSQRAAVAGIDVGAGVSDRLTAAMQMMGVTNMPNNMRAGVAASGAEAYSGLYRGKAGGWAPYLFQAELKRGGLLKGVPVEQVNAIIEHPDIVPTMSNITRLMQEGKSTAAQDAIVNAGLGDMLLGKFNADTNSYPTPTNDALQKKIDAFNRAMRETAAYSAVYPGYNQKVTDPNNPKGDKIDIREYFMGGGTATPHLLGKLRGMIRPGQDPWTVAMGLGGTSPGSNNILDRSAWDAPTKAADAAEAAGAGGAVGTATEIDAAVKKINQGSGTRADELTILGGLAKAIQGFARSDAPTKIQKDTEEAAKNLNSASTPILEGAKIFKGAVDDLVKKMYVTTPGASQSKGPPNPEGKKR